jgi:hypothetical protein
LDLLSARTVTFLTRLPVRTVDERSVGGAFVNVDVSTDIVFNRPPEIVARYASDPDHVARLVREHQVRRMADSKAAHYWIAVAFVAYFLRRIAYTYEIMEL